MRRFALLSFLATFLVAGAGLAQDEEVEVIQAGDVLRLVMPDDAGGAGVDRVVDRDGMVDLGRFGVVRVAGADLEMATERVRERLARTRRDAAGASLSRVRRGVLIGVSGLVAHPGDVSLPVHGDLWAAIMAAGGAVDGGDLGQVRLSRDGEVIARIDVVRWLEAGSVAIALPALVAGDLVFVPARRTFSASSDERPVWEPSHEEVSNTLRPGVNVIGGVQKPGRVTLARPLPLLDVLALVGGPTRDGDLHRVTLIRGTPGLTATSVVDAATHPAAGLERIVVQPGDTVVVATRDEDPIRMAVQVVSNVALVAGVIGVLVGMIGAAQ